MKKIFTLLFAWFLIGMVPTPLYSFFDSEELSEDFHHTVHSMLDEEGRKNYRALSREFYIRDLIYTMGREDFIELLRGNKFVEFDEIVAFRERIDLDVIDENFRIFWKEKPTTPLLMGKTFLRIATPIGFFSGSVYLSYFAYLYERPAPELTPYGRLVQQDPTEAASHVLACEERAYQRFKDMGGHLIPFFNELNSKTSKFDHHEYLRESFQRRASRCFDTHIYPGFNYWLGISGSATLVTFSGLWLYAALKTFPDAVAFHHQDFGEISYYDLYIAYRAFYRI